jgi:hypothetical protein
MGIDDLFGFDSEKYYQSLHSKYPTIEALQANEKKKSEQIAAATGGAVASYGLVLAIGPVAALGIGLSGRNLAVATQKRDLIRKALKERYEVEKTSMSGKTFFTNAGLAVAVKAVTFGAGHGVEHFCTAAIPPGIDAAPHGFDAAAAAVAHPDHCLEGVKQGMMSEVHALHTLATTGSPDAAAMPLDQGPPGDNAYLTGAAIGDHAARGVEKGLAKLAIKGGSKMAASKLNNPTSTPHSKPPTSKSINKPTIAPTAAEAQQEYLRRRKAGLASTTQTQNKTDPVATTARKPTQSTVKRPKKEFKQQLHLSSAKKQNSNIANCSIAGPASTQQTRNKTDPAATTTRKPTQSTIKRSKNKFKQRLHISSVEKFNSNIAKCIAAVCIFVTLTAIAFYKPIVFRILLTVSSKILINLAQFIGYAVVEIIKSVLIISGFAGYLIGAIANFIVTIILPNVIFFIGYGLFKLSKVILEIFDFIGHLLASIFRFAATKGRG